MVWSDPDKRIVIPPEEATIDPKELVCDSSLHQASRSDEILKGGPVEKLPYQTSHGVCTQGYEYALLTLTPPTQLVPGSQSNALQNLREHSVFSVTSATLLGSESSGSPESSYEDGHSPISNQGNSQMLHQKEPDRTRRKRKKPEELA
ncbi:uncharacterized protein PV06_11476 [Exophiala oligosperma]|uniref:Uncharacterized protein n=1 Tax=Exophiala oligosperma TaxID=215243 RepID=A0A0D2D1Z6_9EURO|nr:uncharacterized protein PV06_11476 [Exophiala oligosperma]KIW36255.1 hypothetical protein PV06_11476 [Exophiala oligosperma]